MARRNHHRVELLVVVHANGIHAENKFLGGHHNHIRIILYLIRVDRLLLGRDA